MLYFQNQHCIIKVSLEAVERLHANEVYPIVLFIKFKSAKQIKEVKESRYNATDKMSQKDAKTIFEHAQKLEHEFKHLISDTIHAGKKLIHSPNSLKLDSFAITMYRSKSCCDLKCKCFREIEGDSK